MIGLAWPLAAANAMETLLVFAIVIVSVIVRLINKAREVQRQAGRNLPRDAAQPLPPAPEKRDPLADEIEDFLKRAAQRRQAAAQRRATPAPEPVLVLAPAESEAPHPEGTRRLVQAPAVELSPQPESVAAHVQDLLSAAKFTTASQELGKEVTDLDRGLQRHLRETFDQRLGQLTGLGGESATPQGAVELDASSQSVTVSAENFSGLTALFANPVSLRQAVVFSEIFNRPEDRWG